MTQEAFMMQALDLLEMQHVILCDLQSILGVIQEDEEKMDKRRILHQKTRGSACNFSLCSTYSCHVI